MLGTQLGADGDHVVDDVGQATGAQRLLGEAEVGAPMDQQIRGALHEPLAGEVPIEHDHDRATRESPSLQLGVSPRGITWLLHASKAWAWLSGREFVTPDEVKAVAKPCLRHRIMVRPELELEGTSADAVLDGILATVPTPR